MAGFRHAPRDRYDDDLENWALWYVGCSIGASLARRDPAEGAGGEFLPNREILQALTVVSWREGDAQDTDAELTRIQDDITKSQETWPVKRTVARWYAGTGTDEYEAAYLKIPRQTFSDRMGQIKRRLADLHDSRLSNKGRSMAY